MNEVQGAPPVLCFGAFEVNCQSRELRKYGLRIRLEAKLFQILELLLERAGQVVTRRALRERLWPDTHVGYEHGLNTAINKLRDLLGDSARSPRFIETIPRLGYRFIAPLIRRGRNSTPGERRMVVVLPFEDLNGDGKQEPFSDGLMEETILQLGQLDPRRLGVIARTSAARYKTTKKSIGEIAEELRVDYVLEGSVRGEGRRLRITAQLIETQDQTHRWSASYDPDPHDILDAQSEVAKQIAKAVASELLAGNSSIARTLPGNFLVPEEGVEPTRY